MIFLRWTSLNELREKFLSFFESKGHLKLKSFSLVPENDNSLLLINSGMAPMKKFFTGELTPPSKRITTCQKCIRTLDIDRVGITARHGTFFEMLGNFSFGDYFKNEATAWAWEFCTKVLELPIDRLWVSIYEEDNDAFDIWTKNVGVDPSRIVRLGKNDNFWEHGLGPCGPCSELYFDRGEKYGCGSPNCKVGCDCDRYIEFWNLVFTQFENDGQNNYSDLAHPNIDTGMGLERLACLMQEVDNLFLVDTVQNIMRHVCKIFGVRYGENTKNDISLRVITDHIRSITFMIADGVLPSNEGRGYVLRRLLRRAARHGRLLGENDAFLSDLSETVIKENMQAYPELLQKQKTIKDLIGIEEKNFARTIDLGLELLNAEMKKAKTKVLSGEVAFKLHDTFGFPIDLTKEILQENKMSVDEDRFNELLLDQKNRARLARVGSENQAWKPNEMNFSNIEATEFVGYEKLVEDTCVLRIIKNNSFIDIANKNDEIEIVLNKSPFYAQGGGQIGDSGELFSDHVKIKISNTIKNSSGTYLHSAKVIEGSLKVRDTLTACVDKVKRNKIMRNHTAAHLLHAALRKILGDHVRQAGQLVDDCRLRFDFTHFSALNRDDLNKIENIVNDEILRSEDVTTKEMSVVEAKKIGAMALFNEKYGDIVRVVRAGEFSLELCGGTHVDNTAQIGVFKILSESSVASGVRRIEAITSLEVLSFLNDKQILLDECQKILRVNQQSELAKECKFLVDKLKKDEQIIRNLNSEIAASKINDLINNAKNIAGLKVIVSKFESFDVNTLKSMCDDIKSKFENAVIVFANIDPEKSNLIVSAGNLAIKKGIDCGTLIKKIANLLGSSGGGRKEMAMAGIKDKSKVDVALGKVYDFVAESII